MGISYQILHGQGDRSHVSGRIQRFFEVLFRAAQEGQEEFPGWKALNFSNPADMAAIQKYLGLGGVCKIKRFFCYCCSLKSEKCAKPNVGNKICKECLDKQQSNPEWLCFHHDMSNEAELEQCQHALEDLKNTWLTNMEEVKKSGKLKLVGAQFKK